MNRNALTLKVKTGFSNLLLGSATLLASAVASAETLKICAILPTSGPSAAIGIGMMNSIELAINQINASGKLGDIKLELMKLDDGSQPSMGVNAAMRAASDPSVIACSAHWNSPVALATRDVFHRNGLANLVPAAITWRLTTEQPGDEIFRMAPPDRWQLEMAARFPVELGNKTFYLIDDNTEYGKSLVTEMQTNAIQAGAQRIGGDSIAVGEKDFTAVLTRAKAANPDFIFFGGVTTESALLRAQMMRLGMGGTLYYTGSGTMSPTFINTAGQAANGAYAFFYGLPYHTYPGGKQFLADYAAAGYDKPYETYGILSYAAGQILADAILAAKEAGNLTRRGVIDQLKSLTFDTALGPASFPAPGDNKERVMGYYVVVDNQWKMTHVSDQAGNITKLDAPVDLNDATE